MAFDLPKLPAHEKVLDPFHSSNICFARFIGRNYVWSTTDGIGKMIPVLPKDHSIDQNNICSDYPAPYQHPMNPAPGLDSSFRTWTDPSQGFYMGFDPYTHNRYFKNAGNITGYPGILKYHAANRFGGWGDEGRILGTNKPNTTESLVGNDPGQWPGDGPGKSVTISPGRVNTFASSYGGAKEICEDFYKEYTKQECYYVASVLNDGQHPQDYKICDRAFGLINGGCPPDPKKPYPGCCFTENDAKTGQDYHKWDCYPPGISCKVTKDPDNPSQPDTNDPQYLPTCAWKDNNGEYLDPNCIDDDDGNPISKDPGFPCTGRYICGVNGIAYANNPNNLCPKFLWKTICSGYEGNTLTMGCSAGDGSECSGGFTGNFCGYTTKNITHGEDESPNIREWRDNGFLSFPPIHITQHRRPPDTGWDPCSGKWRAESCCLWTENDLGEFAVSGKNWMPTYSIGEGSSTGTSGWENSLVGSNALPYREADDDCLPLDVGREKRSLLANPYIIYKGPCCVGGCKQITNPETGIITYVPDSRCKILTADECSVWDGHVDGQPDMDVVNSKTKWRWEGSEKLKDTDFGWWACTENGGGDEPQAFQCGCGDADNLPTFCRTVGCLESLPSAVVPTPPNPADSVRGKMICIENMIRDPEVTNPIGILEGEVYKKGIFIPNTENDCNSSRIEYNKNNFGPDNECNFANKIIIDEAGNQHSSYEFKSCRPTLPGEEQLSHQLNTGAPPASCVNPNNPGTCCTCYRDWNEFISTLPGGFDSPSFRTTCLSRNGVYREDSRCPHGGNATYLKDKYRGNGGHKEIEGYRTHCHGDNWALAGPMTCNPGEEWKSMPASEYSSKKIIVEPDWTCPRSDMYYNRSYNQVWPNSIYDLETDCITKPEFGTWAYSTIYTPPIIGIISQVAGGNDFSVALKTQTTDAATSNILIWGNGALQSMTKLPGIFAKDISVAYNHILGIDGISNEVYAWGENDNGQLNYPGYTGETRIKAKKIAASSGFYPWSGFSIAINDSNNLVVWGTNGFAPTGEFKDLSIEKLPAVNGCKEVIAGDLFAYAICGNDEKIYRWGRDGVSAPGVTGAKQIACIPQWTPDPEAFYLLVLRQVGVSYDGGPHQVGRVSLLTSGVEGGLWDPPQTITRLGLDPRIDIKHISAGYNHFLALGSSGEVYAWGDNSRGQCGIPGITNARSGVGCQDDPNPNAPCPVPNNYKSISGGKNHSIGLRNTTSSLLDENFPISVWGLIEPTNILSGQSESDICKKFSGFTLSSGNTLNVSGCGLCTLRGTTWEFSNRDCIRQNSWAIPGNPFDPVGYLGLHTRISWENACDSISIKGLPEESKLNGEQNYYNFIIMDNGGITNLPGPMTRASGDEGRCRSHIGAQALMIQQGDDGCIQPGVNVIPNPTYGAPRIHTRETTYSGPCWPCPQLYDSLGTEAFLYGTTHGLTGREGTLPNSYIMEIKLSGGQVWNPCVWGKMDCDADGLGLGIWTNSLWDRQQLDFTSLDFKVDGEFTQEELKCCSHSSPGYQDQIQVVGADAERACPDGGECWRCPGWNYQTNPADPNTMAWDGTPASKKYFDYACAYDAEYNQTHRGCLVPDDAGALPFAGVCTIFEGDGLGVTRFVGITSGIGSPAAGRTMCFCQGQGNGNYYPAAIDPTHGGPGCTFGPICESIVCALLPRCCSVEWDENCAGIAALNCPACASRQSHQECQNYHALKWCADKYNDGPGWTGGKTVGLDLFGGCPGYSPYEAEHPDMITCEACVKCDLPLCRHKYNCNLKCPCGTYGMDCQPTCTDPSGSYGPYIKTTCNGKWPGEFNVY